MVVLRVPAAMAQPVSFHEVEYIRIHSAKVKLASHADKEARLWARLNTRADWSAELVSTATVADLDASALAVGRLRFAEKHPHLAGEVAGWDVPTLLSRLIRVCQLGLAGGQAITSDHRNSCCAKPLREGGRFSIVVAWLHQNPPADKGYARPLTPRMKEKVSR
ncbi:MAG TPA: hypothetical protein PLB25_03360 [Rhodoferax sp.]|nr:hypothetical protein [Rhodoferax sp.]